MIYAVEKTFEYVEDDWQGDAHVTMRTKNFKGKYAVEITGCFKQTDSQVYYDIIGRDSSGNKAVVGRYRSDSGYYGYFSVYNNKLNGANTNRYHLWQDCRITREISTYLDTPEATFKTLLNGSGIACETVVEGVNPKSVFPMTDWNPKGKNLYITGIRISGQRQEEQGGTVILLNTNMTAII